MIRAAGCFFKAKAHGTNPVPWLPALCAGFGFQGVATASSSCRGFLIGKSKGPRHKPRAVATRPVRGLRFPGGSHGKLFLPWVLNWEKQRPTATRPVRGLRFPGGSHGKLFLPWVLNWEKQRPTAPESCRGYGLSYTSISDDSDTRPLHSSPAWCKNSSTTTRQPCLTLSMSSFLAL